MIGGGREEKKPIKHNSTYLKEGDHVANGDVGLESTVNELSGVSALRSDDKLLLELETIGVTEDDLSERRSTSRVVDNVFHDTHNVAVTLSIVESTVLGGTLAMLDMGSEDRSTSLTLSTDNTTHISLVCMV